MSEWVSEWQGHLLSCPGQLKNKTQTQTKCPQHKINYNLIAGRGRTSLPEHKRHRCYQSFPCRLGSRSPWIACFEIDVEITESWNDCTSQTLHCLPPHFDFCSIWTSNTTMHPTAMLNWHPKQDLTYDKVSDLMYNWVAQRPDFKSALRVVKMVPNT